MHSFETLSFLHFPLVATIFWIRSNVIVVTDNDVIGCYKAVYMEYVVWSDVIHFFKSEGVIECEIFGICRKTEPPFCR